MFRGIMEHDKYFNNNIMKNTGVCWRSVKCFEINIF